MVSISLYSRLFVCKNCSNNIRHGTTLLRLSLPKNERRLQRFMSTPSNDANAVDLSQFPPERIRNFSIIAHIDHGKSTLADRLLEITKTIRRDSSNKQVLDKLEVERMRGITIKAQTASMFHEFDGQKYLLNLIDTPGHVDFSYEVSRSLAACQGALLLVDACQGIQAQTVANFYLAFGEGLNIIPVINKVDLPAADPKRIAKQIENAFEIDTTDVLQVSAKTGLNCTSILDAVVNRVPSPTGDVNNPLKAFLFDSWYDQYLGVICLFRIIDGQLRKGDKIVSIHSNQKYEVLDVGIMHPERISTDAIFAGQVGYVIAGMKSASEAHVGDTFHLLKQPVEPLPGFKPAKSMVFSGVFPVNAGDFKKLHDSINKLTLNDASVFVQRETSMALGQGWRLGFLGTLHMDVFRQRLEQEYEANVINTAPTVPYKILYTDGRETIVRNPSEFPEGPELPKVKDFCEPMINATIILPDKYLGQMIELCNERRGVEKEMTYIDDSRVMLKYTLPMAEIVTDFYDELKSISSGYASFDYEESGYEESDLVKMDVLLNSKPVDALAVILHRSKVDKFGRGLVKKLKDVIDRQLYEVAIQAAVGSRIIARETVPALRKNVTAKCYGGDVTRKMKLLNRQKEGKKRMKMVGNVELSQEAFLSVMKK